MKAQNITIDINQLTTEELDQLAAMLYRMGDMRTTKTINDRKAFQEGWMSDRATAEYIERYC